MMDDYHLEFENGLAVRKIMPNDAEWPPCLNDLGEDMPSALWVSGMDLADLLGDAVSIVGTRTSTGYGEHVASQFAHDLGEAGHTLVSGSAFGTDSAVQRMARTDAHPSVCVVAGGLDVLGGHGNLHLMLEAAAHGTLVTACPPGDQGTHESYIEVQRLVAAMGSTLIVVEGTPGNMCQHAIDAAERLGRPIWAVPGPVTSGTSWLPHELIRDGVASLAAYPTDVRVPEHVAQREIAPGSLSVEMPRQAAALAAITTVMDTGVPMESLFGHDQEGVATAFWRESSKHEGPTEVGVPVEGDSGTVGKAFSVALELSTVDDIVCTWYDDSDMEIRSTTTHVDGAWDKVKTSEDLVNLAVKEGICEHFSPAADFYSNSVRRGVHGDFIEYYNTSGPIEASVDDPSASDARVTAVWNPLDCGVAVEDPAQERGL